MDDVKKEIFLELILTRSSKDGKQGVLFKLRSPILGEYFNEVCLGKPDDMGRSRWPMKGGIEYRPFKTGIDLHIPGVSFIPFGGGILFNQDKCMDVSFLTDPKLKDGVETFFPGLWRATEIENFAVILESVVRNIYEDFMGNLTYKLTILKEAA